MVNVKTVGYSAIYLHMFLTYHHLSPPCHHHFMTFGWVYKWSVCTSKKYMWRENDDKPCIKHEKTWWIGVLYFQTTPFEFSVEIFSHDLPWPSWPAAASRRHAVPRTSAGRSPASTHLRTWRCTATWLSYFEDNYIVLILVFSIPNKDYHTHTDTYIYICMCTVFTHTHTHTYIHIYIYIHIARGLAFGRNARNSMRDCNFLSCFHACFLKTTSRACKILFFYPRLIAFLRLPKTVPKLPFEAYLKDILCNLQCFEQLTETSTNCKTLQEPQTNLTLNQP